MGTRLADGVTVALHEDITEQRAALAQIAFLARHDPLTGLPNRQAIAEGFVNMLARNARGEEFAVLCVDLDRFKAVNDSFGHAVGDVLVAQVAQRLRDCVRDTEFVARLGGDEFVVLQCGAPQPVGSTALARRIIAVLGEPRSLTGTSWCSLPWRAISRSAVPSPACCEGWVTHSHLRHLLTACGWSARYPNACQRNGCYVYNSKLFI